MAPLITLVVVTLLARLAGTRKLGGEAFVDWPGAARAGVAAMFVVTGAAHFVGLREDLIRMVPPAFGAPAFWVTFTGVAEIAGAIGLLVPATRRAAAVGLCLLLVLVLPANVYAATHGVAFGGRDATPLVPRVLEQVAFFAAVAFAGFGSAKNRPAGPESRVAASST